MNRSVGALVATAVFLGIAACDVDPLDRPVFGAAGPERDRPFVEVSCTNSVPSSDRVTLIWNSHPPLDDRHRLDLSVYKNGFAQGRYASLWPLERGQRPQRLKSSKLRPSPAEPTLRPRLTRVGSDPEQGSASVSLEGLEPGLVYELRLLTLKDDGWLPGSVARVQGPVCITEAHRESAEP